MTGTSSTPVEDQILSVTDGRDHADIEQRAGRATDRANEAPARAGWADRTRDGVKAIRRAAAWVHVLRHPGSTGDTVFSNSRLADRNWSLTATSGLRAGLRELFSRAPFTFCTPPNRPGEAPDPPVGDAPPDTRKPA